MTYRLEFILDGLPSTANSHRHHFIAGRERKEWRKRVKLRCFMERPLKPLTLCKITCTRFSSVEPDYDNLVISFKACCDGLKDAGIILDDKPSIVKERAYHWYVAPRNKGRIQIIVEEL